MKPSDHPTDQLFRKVLGDHTMVPSEAARAAFLKEAASIPPPARQRRRRIWLLMIPVLITLAGLVLWYSGNDKPLRAPADVVTAPEPGPVLPAESPSGGHKEKLKVSTGSIADKTEPKPVTASAKAANSTLFPALPQAEQTSPAGTTLPVYESTHEDNSGTRSMEATAVMSPAIQGSVTNQAAAGEIIIPEDSQPTTSENLAQIATETTQETANKPATEPVAATEDQPTATPAARTINDSIPLSGSGETSKIVKPQRTREGSWHAGIYYTPEWMYNTLEGKNFVNNIGIEASFNHGPFMIRTGAGISVGKGANEVLIEYNDYLGAYNRLDSMDFKWDDPTQQYLPTYYMTRQDVWDSLILQEQLRVVKRYTYLHIPVAFGYDFYRAKNFSLGVTAGPTLSILLKSKQISDSYDPGKKRVVKVNDISPGQVNLNWQVMAGLKATFLVTRRIGFEIEPQAKYYFNSVYEKPVNNAKPWSVGIRAAIHIAF